MVLTLELVLLLVLVLALGVWGVWTGVRQSRQAANAPVAPQQLASLAQPYRNLMGEAVAIGQDVRRQAGSAPKTLEHELGTLAWRVEQLVKRALPRAQHGTRLAAYLLELGPDDAQFAATQTAAREVERDLKEFVATLKTLRGKVYQVLTDATQLGADQRLSQDLDDALIEIGALEEAFSEMKSVT